MDGASSGSIKNRQVFVRKLAGKKCQGRHFLPAFQGSAGPCPLHYRSAVTAAPPLQSGVGVKSSTPRLASPSFRAQTRNLWNLALWTSTAPESTFVASACECGVAVQGDGHMRRSRRFSKGRHHFENMFPPVANFLFAPSGRLRSLSGASLRPFHLAVRSLR